MRKALTALVLVSALATSGCASMMGKRRAPDEFAVARNAPLIIPPDFSLAPPVAGTAGLTPSEAQQQAIDALFGGPADAPIGIRSTVWDPDTRIVDKGAATLQILSAPATSSNVASAQAGQ
jgi:hypothetical protein